QGGAEPLQSQKPALASALLQRAHCPARGLPFEPALFGEEALLPPRIGAEQVALADCNRARRGVGGLLHKAHFGSAAALVLGDMLAESISVLRAVVATAPTHRRRTAIAHEMRDLASFPPVDRQRDQQAEAI